MLIHFPQACHTHFVSPEHASLTLRKRRVEFHFFYIVEEIQVLLMVLGKIFKSASRDLSPDIPSLPTAQGSSCVSSSGCACAILGLSFPVASRAGVFHGTRELPGSTLPPRFVLNTCVWTVWCCWDCRFISLPFFSHCMKR